MSGSCSNRPVGDGLVVNWLPEHPASGGAVCWVLQGGEWQEYYESGVE